MILNENGEQLPNRFKNTLIQITNIVLNESLVFIDIMTKSVIRLKEIIVGVYTDDSLLVIKNEKSTYCFIPV